MPGEGGAEGGPGAAPEGWADEAPESALGKARGLARDAAAAALRAGARMRRILFRALFLVPVYALLGLIALGGAATLLLRGGDASGWAALGGATVLLVYGVAGLVGGALLGAIVGARRTLAGVEDEVAGWLRALPAGPPVPGLPEIPLTELRSTYEGVLDRMVEETLGRFRLPGPLRRFVKSRLRRAAVEDFVDWCEARGESPVGVPLFRDWALERGLEMAVRAPRIQLRLWRLGTLGALGVAVAVAVVLRLVG